ncbi:MAG: NF038122 family metalloprotease [Phenylobacterium sp.]
MTGTTSRPRRAARTCLLGAAVLTLGLSAAHSAGALTIVPTFDKSVTSLANASAIEAAFNTVAHDYDTAFSNAVTINVGVSWGSVAGQALPGGAVGASSDNLYGYFTYGQVKSFLTSGSQRNPADTSLATAIAALPAATPSGPSKYVLPSAEAKALGLISGTSTSVDGYIGFAGAASGYTFDPSGGILAGTYDFEAVAAHEIAEVLGRTGGINSASPAWRTPFDLYRYSAPGVLDAGYKDAAYFSINGGVTALKAFNNAASGDRSDWLSLAGVYDVQNAFLTTGQAYSLSNVDLTSLDVLGWGGGNPGNLAVGNPNGRAFGLVSGSVPEPRSWAILTVGFFGLGSAFRTARRRRKPQYAERVL